MDATTTKFLWTQGALMVCLVAIGVIAVTMWRREHRENALKNQWDEVPHQRTYTIGTNGQLHVVRVYRNRITGLEKLDYSVITTDPVSK